MSVLAPPGEHRLHARLARACRRVPLLAAATAVVVLGLLRALTPGAFDVLGPAVLLTGLLLGLPHGAVDVARASGGAPLRRQAGPALGYLGLTLGVLALWWWQPLPVLLGLLAITIIHFGHTDLSAQRWARAEPPRGDVRTAATVFARGGPPVLLPFALWPAQTRPLLDLLTSGHAEVVTTVSRWALPLLALALALAAERETVLLVVLFVVAPPLAAFGVYFAAWHAWRQTLQLLATETPQPPSVRAALTRFARTAALPTATALVGLGVLVALWGTGIPAAYLVLLLAITVPHALISARTDGVTPRSPRSTGENRKRSP